MTPTMRQEQKEYLRLSRKKQKRGLTAVGNIVVQALPVALESYDSA